MKRIATILLLTSLIPSLIKADDIAGQWDVGIECPGGAIEFGLDLGCSGDRWTAFLVNGPERIKVPKVSVDGSNIQLNIDHYDSRLTLKFDSGEATGSWRKRRGVSEYVEMNCVAKKHRSAKFEANDAFIGRWKVQFESSDDSAVGIFKKVPGSNRVLGTFLTSTGDYRFLDGGVNDGQLRLSCFDGAHAFLFRASLRDNQELSGEFWSSNTWHESWTAKLDPTASIPDDFQQTKIADTNLGALRFPDLDGKLMSLDDPSFGGKARIIYVFGSWCPNCHDAGAYFAALDQKYRDRGLSILGLAFEMTGDFERDARQVRSYLKRHGSDYPVLLAGMSDKKLASKSLPLLDRVRSYPTTIFIDKVGNVQAVHTGFTGPATGNSFKNLKLKFEALIETMLSD